MSVRLTLLCHGRIAASGPISFPADEPVDPAHLVGLPSLCDRLGRPDRVWSGPEARCRGTAGALVATLAMSIAVVAALRDGDFGTWRGRTLGEIETDDPAGAAAWLVDPAATPHGGESLAALRARVGDWLDGHADPGRTIAVTHPAVIRAAVLHCLDAPSSAFWRIDVTHLAVADLRRHGTRWTLRSLGATA